jgi:hypothetical protein
MWSSVAEMVQWGDLVLSHAKLPGPDDLFGDERYAPIATLRPDWVRNPRVMGLAFRRVIGQSVW